MEIARAHPLTDHETPKPANDFSNRPQGPASGPPSDPTPTHPRVRPLGPRQQRDWEGDGGAAGPTQPTYTPKAPQRSTPPDDHPAPANRTARPAGTSGPSRPGSPAAPSAKPLRETSCKRDKPLKALTQTRCTSPGGVFLSAAQAHQTRIERHKWTRHKAPIQRSSLAISWRPRRRPRTSNRAKISSQCPPARCAHERPRRLVQCLVGLRMKCRHRRGQQRPAQVVRHETQPGSWLRCGVLSRCRSFCPHYSLSPFGCST